MFPPYGEPRGLASLGPVHHRVRALTRHRRIKLMDEPALARRHAARSAGTEHSGARWTQVNNNKEQTMKLRTTRMVVTALFLTASGTAAFAAGAGGSTSRSQAGTSGRGGTSDSSGRRSGGGATSAGSGMGGGGC
jgi:hypothetical protein